MIEITSSVHVRRPAEEVFAVIADMSRNPEWQGGMRSCVWTSEPPISAGSTYDQEAVFLGRSIRTSFEVVEFERPHRIRIVSTASTFPLDITRTVEPEGDGVRVEALVKGRPGRVMMLFAPLVRRLVRRSVQSDYRRLKELLEG